MEITTFFIIQGRLLSQLNPHLLVMWCNRTVFLTDVSCYNVLVKLVGLCLYILSLDARETHRLVASCLCPNQSQGSNCPILTAASSSVPTLCQTVEHAHFIHTM